MSTKIKRSVYADMFGPTTGDKVRLALNPDRLHFFDAQSEAAI